MKKFMTMMLGLSLVLGGATVVFGQDAPAPAKKEKKAKKAKTKKEKKEKAPASDAK